MRDTVGSWILSAGPLALGFPLFLFPFFFCCFFFLFPFFVWVWSFLLGREVYIYSLFFFVFGCYFLVCGLSLFFVLKRLAWFGFYPFLMFQSVFYDDLYQTFVFFQWYYHCHREFDMVCYWFSGWLFRFSFEVLAGWLFFTECDIQCFCFSHWLKGFSVSHVCAGKKIITSSVFAWLEVGSSVDWLVEGLVGGSVEGLVDHYLVQFVKLWKVGGENGLKVGNMASRRLVQAEFFFGSSPYRQAVSLKSLK